MTTKRTRTALAAAITAIIGIVPAAAIVLATASPAGAASVFNVTITADEDDGNPTDCDSGDADCSLREAVRRTNDPSSGNDTINLPAATYVLGLGGTNCELSINPVPTTESVTIQALAGAATIDTAASCTAGRVVHNQGIGTLTLTNLTITGGRNAPMAISGGGGGIRTQGNLVMDSVTVTGNSTNAANAGGGGIYAAQNVNITNSTISANKTLGTSSSGGGLLVENHATLLTTTITGNEVVGTGFGSGGGLLVSNGFDLTLSTISANKATSDGGGIRSQAGDSTITDSSISGNVADSDDDLQGDGGGFFFQFNSLTVTKSTISGNTARGGGGVLTDTGGPGTLLIDRSTLSGNVATDGTAAIASGRATTIRNSTVSGNDGQGALGVGGIYMHLTGGLALADATIASNTGLQTANLLFAASGQQLTSFGSVLGDPLGGGPVCTFIAGTSTVTQGSNFEEGTDTCGFGSGTGDVENGPDPALGALADNAGPTKTRMPAPASALVDVVTDCNGPADDITTDQRELPRPGKIGTTCDIGAIERQPGKLSGFARDLPAPKGNGAAHPSPAFVNVRVCPSGQPGCATAIGEIQANPADGRYTISNLDPGASLVAGVYCKLASSCVSGPYLPLDVLEGGKTTLHDPVIGFRPDVMARHSASPVQTGSNTYSPPTPVPTRNAGVKKNKAVTFVIRFDNDGNLVDTVRLKATAAGSSQLSVTYRQGAFPIPNLATTGRTYTLAPGGAKTVTVTIRAKGTSKLLNAKTVALTATSLGQATGAKTDTVKVKAVRS